MRTVKRWIAGVALAGYLGASGAALAQPPASQPSRVARDAQVGLGLVESGIGGIGATIGTVILVPVGFLTILCGELANTQILFPFIGPAFAGALIYKVADVLTANSLWLWDHGVANIRGTQVDRNHPSKPLDAIDYFGDGFDKLGSKLTGRPSQLSGGGQDR